MKTKWFVPNKDVRVLDPTTMKPVHAEGVEVVSGNPYFIRRADEESGRLLASKPVSKAKKDA